MEHTNITTYVNNINVLLLHYCNATTNLRHFPALHRSCIMETSLFTVATSNQVRRRNSFNQDNIVQLVRKEGSVQVY